jgi:hypothetical protein
MIVIDIAHEAYLNVTDYYITHTEKDMEKALWTYS